MALIDPKNLSQSTEAFIAIKSLSIKLFVFKEKIDKILDKSINDFIKQAGGFSIIGKLGILFKRDRVGSMIMSEHKIFDSFQRSLFNRKTLSQGIEYVVADLEGDLLDKKKLRRVYDEFKECFDSIVMEYLKPVINFEVLIGKLRAIVAEVEDPMEWGEDLKEKLPSIIG